MQVLLKQYVCFCMYILNNYIYIYLYTLFVYIKHNAYPATEVKRQIPTLLKSCWLTDFYTLYQRNSTFLSKILEKTITMII